MRKTCWTLVIAVTPLLLATRLAAQDGATPATPTISANEAEAEAPTIPADEAAIRANCEKYVEAYNRRDSQTMASMWSPEAVYMDPNTGQGVVGRDAIKQQFDHAFAGAEDAKLAVTIDSIEFVSPNVAIEKGAVVVTYANFEPEESVYSAVHVKRDGEWLLDRVSESDAPVPAPSHYEHLQELDWMVGSWIDDNQGTRIETDCEWTKNRNFLTRSFAMRIGDEIQLSGMQIIGWDPANEQIRSWVFDSDGGFSEGKWTRMDDRWIIQKVGTLAAGGQSTATDIITYLDPDSFTWQSIDRTVDGEVLPNIEEALVKRKPAVEE